MTRTTMTLIAVLGAALLAAPAADAATYRGRDVERALVREFRGGHGGSSASAACSAVSSDTKWRCRIRRTGKERSAAFELTIASKGRWKTTSFKFAGFTARYKLSGCCLARR